MKNVYSLLCAVLCVVVSNAWAAEAAEPQLTITLKNETNPNLTIYYKYCRTSVPWENLACTEVESGFVDRSKSLNVFLPKGTKKASQYTRFYFSTVDDFTQTNKKNVYSILLPQNAHVFCPEGKVIFTIKNTSKKPNELKVTDNCGLLKRAGRSIASTFKRSPKPITTGAYETVSGVNIYQDKPSL